MAAVIKASEAHKYYDRNTPVVRKGDKDWVSDNHHQGRQGERTGLNPLSVMDQKIRQRASREVDYSLLPPTSAFDLGWVVKIPMENGRDMMAFRLVEVKGEDRDRRMWKYVWVEKNGALK